MLWASYMHACAWTLVQLASISRRTTSPPYCMQAAGGVTWPHYCHTGLACSAIMGKLKKCVPNSCWRQPTGTTACRLWRTALRSQSRCSNADHLIGPAADSIHVHLHLCTSALLWSASLQACSQRCSRLLCCTSTCCWAPPTSGASTLQPVAQAQDCAAPPHVWQGQLRTAFRRDCRSCSASEGSSSAGCCSTCCCLLRGTLALAMAAMSSPATSASTCTAANSTAAGYGGDAAFQVRLPCLHADTRQTGRVRGAAVQGSVADRRH